MAGTIEPLTIDETESNEEEAAAEGPRAKWRQYYLAGAAHTGAFIMATVWSWSSTALISLRESQAELGDISRTDEAWIASITFLAGAVGGPFMGFIAQKRGLKMSLHIATFAMTIGWALIVFAPNMTVILVGRFLTGCFAAGVGVSNSLVAELCAPCRRGRLNFGFDLLFCAGVVFIYVIGTIWSWRIQAAGCAVICLLFFVLLLTIPESPVCLIQQGKASEAKKALQKLMDKENVDYEFNKFKESVDSDKEKERHGRSSHLKTVLNRQTLKPILIAISLQFFLQVCGVVPIVCYAVDVFKSAGTELIHENISTIVLGVVNLVATCIAALIVDKHGRRPLMMGSEACLTITLTILGIFLYLKNVLHYSLDNWSWFPLACFVIFISGYSFGVGPVPWVIMGDIFSQNAKGFSNGVVTVASRVFGFLVMFFFKDMVQLIGQHGVYWFFAGVCLAGFIFSYFLLPETKNRELDEIQAEIKDKWFHHRRHSKGAGINLD